MRHIMLLEEWVEYNNNTQLNESWLTKLTGLFGSNEIKIPGSLGDKIDAKLKDLEVKWPFGWRYKGTKNALFKAIGKYADDVWNIYTNKFDDGKVEDAGSKSKEDAFDTYYKIYVKDDTDKDYDDMFKRMFDEQSANVRRNDIEAVKSLSSKIKDEEDKKAYEQCVDNILKVTDSVIDYEMFELAKKMKKDWSNALKEKNDKKEKAFADEKKKQDAEAAKEAEKEKEKARASISKVPGFDIDYDNISKNNKAFTNDVIDILTKNKTDKDMGAAASKLFADNTTAKKMANIVKDNFDDSPVAASAALYSYSMYDQAIDKLAAKKSIDTKSDFYTMGKYLGKLLITNVINKDAKNLTDLVGDSYYVVKNAYQGKYDTTASVIVPVAANILDAAANAMKPDTKNGKNIQALVKRIKTGVDILNKIPTE